MMKSAFIFAFLAVTCALAAIPQGIELHDNFAMWALKFKKSYDTTAEFKYRLSVFNETLHRIERLNTESTSAKFDVNQFSDMTPEEFRSIILMTKVPEAPKQLETIDPPTDFAAPTSFDWRSKNAVTPVKNQGQCGSCWAFSATETIESAWIIAGNSMVVLGPQQIVDCDTVDQACNGGLPTNAFDYVQTAGGQETEADYPYQAAKGTCEFDKSKVAATISGHFAGTTGNDEKTLQANLVAYSPISIAVDATAWQDYSNGIMTASQCNGQQMDHAVQLVGYDASGSTPYWIVRNSWATSWGIEGYIWLEMWQNTCLMAENTSLAKAGSSVTTSTTTASSSSAATGEVDVEPLPIAGGNGAIPAQEDSNFMAA